MGKISTKNKEMMRIVSDSWKVFILINSKSIGMSHIIRVLYLIVISNEL